MLPDMPFTFAEHTRWDDPAALDRVEAERRPFDLLNRRIIEAVVTQAMAPIAPDARVIEFGAGDGQLRRWLPATLLPHVLHTEPADAYLERFRRRHPAAPIEQAGVYELPCADASQDAVISLCAYDALHDPQRARDEMRRVLRPGGLFIHWLDSAAHCEPLFRELVSKDQLPLPNFLDGEVTAEHLDPARRARLPDIDPLDDLIITSQRQFREIFSLFRVTHHPLTPTLEPYARLFDAQPFDAESAAQAFASLSADAPQLATLNRALLAVYLALNESDRDGVMPFTVSSFAAWKYLRGKLESHFEPGEGFTLELSDLVWARRIAPRDADLPAGCHYHARWLGKQAFRSTAPSSLPGFAADQLSQSPPVEYGATASAPQSNQVTRESAMFVFIARKR